MKRGQSCMAQSSSLCHDGGLANAAIGVVRPRRSGCRQHLPRACLRRVDVLPMQRAHPSKISACLSAEASPKLRVSRLSPNIAAAAGSHGVELRFVQACSGRQLRRKVGSWGDHAVGCACGLSAARRTDGVWEEEEQGSSASRLGGCASCPVGPPTAPRLPKGRHRIRHSGRSQDWPCAAAHAAGFAFPDIDTWSVVPSVRAAH